MTAELSSDPRRRALAVWLALPWRDRLRWAGRKAGEALLGGVGLGVRIRTQDRQWLEQRFLPAYAADPTVQALIFVGCESYTRGYASLFGRGRFRTIDIDPRQARFGSADHIVAPVQDLPLHVAPGSIDVVVCNGVYGFGVDDRVELARAFAGIAAVLKPGGRLLLGWNDVPVLGPFDPAPVAAEAGLVRDPRRGTAWRARTDTPTRHTFDAYCKPNTPSS